MKKTVLASAICLAFASLASAPAMSSTMEGSTGHLAGKTQVNQEMLNALVTAGQRSSRHLQETLGRYRVEHEIADLRSAVEIIRAQQLLDEGSIEIIDEHIRIATKALESRLGEAMKDRRLFKTEGGEIMARPLVQAGLLAGGVGVLVAAASGGSGGSGGESNGDEEQLEAAKAPPGSEEEQEGVGPIDEPVVPELPPAPGDEETPLPIAEGQYSVTGGMDLTNASVAHARGFTGQSAVVAVLDTGFRSTHNELSGQFSGFYNGFTGSELEADAQDSHGHGTHVAGIIAGKDNGDLGIGYAPNTTLLGIRIADAANNLSMSSAQTAAAFRWARENGADFINNSWGLAITARDVDAETVNFYMGPEIAEFRDGVDSDVIYVWANGNEGGAQPQLYAGLPSLFPELKGNWVAVANIDPQTGKLHASSQACGDAAEWCISAPGTAITAPHHTSDSAMVTMTGTSMAAPAVSGALAVLKDAFPMLSNEDILERLFFTADKSGIYANMALYGQGMMDLDAATQPIGDLSLVNAEGSAGLLAFTSLKLGGAFGTANPLRGVEVMALDAQGAGFITDLGGLVRTEVFSFDIDKAHGYFSREAPEEYRNSDGMSLTFSGTSSAGSIDTMVMGFGGASYQTRLGTSADPALLVGSTTLMGMTQQNLTLAAPYWLSDDDTGVSGFSQSIAGLGGAFTVSGMSSEDRQGFSTSYQTTLGSQYTPTLEFGQVKGSDGVFGTEANGALGLGGGANTVFIGLRGEVDHGKVSLYHSAYLGRSQVDSYGLFDSMDAVTTSSWLVGSTFQSGTHRFGLTVGQPLKVESANATLSFLGGYDGGYTYQSVDVDLAPTGRQINTELSYATGTRSIDSLKLSLLRMDQPGHNRDAPADHAVMVSVGTRF